MTPFARKVFNSYSPISDNGAYSRSNLRSHLQDILTKAICFDLTEVDMLLVETASVINEMQSDEDAYTPHGGLVFPPAQYFWAEVRKRFDDGTKHNCAWLGLTEETKPGNIWVKAIEEAISPEGEVEVNSWTGFIEYNNETFGIGVIKDAEDKFNGNAVSGLITALLIINAPYGIKRETPPRHKRHAKEALQKGFELLPHHIIKLDKTAPPRGFEAKGGTGSPKAFHFVRAHRRQYQRGLNVLVKAHWRGDPRLGIHRADYRVK